MTAFFTPERSYSESFYDLAYTRAHPVVPAEAVAVFANRHLRRGDRVLDLGCGAGRHAFYLADLGMNVVAQDMSRVGLGILKARVADSPLASRVETVHADMRELQFADDSFDALVAWGSIYHATRRELLQVLSEIRRVLRPGGFVLVSFKGLQDFQRESGEAVEVDTRYLPEKRLLMHFAERETVLEYMREFQIEYVETERSTQQNGTRWIEQHVVTAKSRRAGEP